MIRAISGFSLLAIVALAPPGCGDDDPMDDSVGDETSNDDDPTTTTIGDETTASDPVADVAAGAEVFMMRCTSGSCHGPDGNSGVGPTLATTIPSRTDDMLESTIQFGVTGAMPGQNLDPQELADLIAYLRETFP